MAQAVMFVALLISFLHLMGLTLAYQKFDYFKLSHEWPPSLCSVSGCVIDPVPEVLIIHGFWPQNLAISPRPTVPKFCYNVPYTPIQDDDLYEKLDNQWPNIRDGRFFNEDYWKHSWLKHGTCAIIFYDQMEYFNLAVRLFDQYDVLVHLLDKGIVPSNSHTYSIERIRLGTKELTTKEPDLYCNTNRQGQIQLVEVRLCFTPGGDIMDCEPATLSDSCSEPQVLFPRNPGSP